MRRGQNICGDYEVTTDTKRTILKQDKNLQGTSDKKTLAEDIDYQECLEFKEKINRKLKKERKISRVC